MTRRYWTRALGAGAVLLAVALFTACGGGGSGTPSAASRGTPSPPPRTSAVAPSPSGTSAPSASPAAGSATPAAQAPDLERAILQAGDLAGKWTPAGRTVTEDREEGTRLCDTANSFRIRRRLTVQFSSNPGQPTLDQSIAELLPGSAQQALDATRALLQSCTEWSGPGQDGRPRTFRVAPVPLPEIGDQRLAFQYSVDDGTGNSVVVLVAQVRRADMISSIVLTAPSGTAPDPALLEQLARRADERLAPVAGG